MIPQPDDIGYAKAFDAYLQAGWKGVLPLPRQAKIWPPSIKCPAAKRKDPDHNRDKCTECISYTGHHGITPSYPDMMAWAETNPLGGLCLRLPNDDTIAVIGIDVDNYGAKHGGDTLREAERRWGLLPGGPRSTSREDDPISGIRLFRVPPGTKLEDVVSFPELGLGDIELIQYHHRYAISWPSIHPEGRPYWWRNEKMQLKGIPQLDELPWLPQAWVDALKLKPRQITLEGAPVTVRQVMTAGDPSPRVHERLAMALKELNGSGISRHDTCLRHVMALARLGKQHESGVHHAMALLREVFVAVVTSDASRTPDVAREEFDRMLTNPNLLHELAQNGVTDWVYDIDPEVGQNVRQNDRPAANPSETAAPPTPGDGNSPNQGQPPPSFGDSPTAEPVSPVPPSGEVKSDLEYMEQGFWDSRESLKQIYQTALAQMASPWAVLAICACRALTTVRPHVTLPPLIGGRGSLNFFAMIVAMSGGGKGAANAAAELLITQEIVIKNGGSGEGIVAAFGRPQDDSDPTPTNEAIMFSIDEIDTLGAMNLRTGSTTLPILRSAFSGETLGFAYAAKEKRRHINKHTYRMTAVISGQPTRLGWLLDDAGGGTPQRFMWFPAEDKRIKKQRPWATGPLSLPHASEWQYPREIQIPDEAADAILDARVSAMQGQQDALDGHALFAREKFAYALAVLDGRTHMTLEDWDLSGIAANVSIYIRELAREEVKKAARIESIERGEQRGIEKVAADEMQQYEEAERVRSTLRWLLEKLDTAEGKTMTTRELTQRASKGTRKWLPAALNIAATNGLIQPGDGASWVKL